MRTIAICLSLGLLLLSFSSCRSVQNRQRQADDLVVSLRLDRAFATRNGDRPHSLRHFDYEADELSDLLLYPIAMFMHAIIQSSVDSMGKTKFVVYPDCRKEYRQRLYWGRNTVFFPADAQLVNGAYRLLVVISGDRSYSGIQFIKPGGSATVDLE